MHNGKTIWIVAGEESGDVYGARLAEQLRRLAPGSCIRGMGGRAMAAAGVDILIDSSELGIVGLIEVVRHLPLIRRAFKTLEDTAQQDTPDVVVLIDYPGFNLRLAARLHARGIRVLYYVSPQVWAWKKGRRHRIARTVDKLLCIFPFEPDVYADTPLDAAFVGHPLIEILSQARDPAVVRDPNTLLLLPGSRRSELERLLDPFLLTAMALKQARPELQFILAQPREKLARLAAERAAVLDPDGSRLGLRIEVGRTHYWMQRAAAGLAASGTVTVEAAILGLPLVVAYRLHWFTHLLARLVVRLPYFTMVNLVAKREVYEEFVQGEVTPPVLTPALRAVLPGGSRHAAVVAGMQHTVDLLGAGGAVSERVAREALALANAP